MGKGLSRYFPKYTKMAKKHMKRCSIPLSIRKMQIKTIVRCHLIPVRMAVRQTKTETLSEGVNTLGPSFCWRESNVAQPLWETICQSLEM